MINIQNKHGAFESKYYPGLRFVFLDLNDSEKLRLISLLLESYECTDQDTFEFAEEFTVVVNHIFGGYLVVRANNLLISEMAQEITSVLREELVPIYLDEMERSGF